MNRLPFHVALIGLVLAVPAASGDTRIALDTGAGKRVETTVPGKFRTLEGVVAALFTLSDQAADKTLVVPFSDPPTVGTWKPLISYFRGARKEGTTITLSFSKGALAYLNASASFQTYVQGSIVDTLRIHYPEMTEVEYEIDGKAFAAWDG